MSNYTPSTLSGDLAPVNAELQKIKTAIDSHLDRNPDTGQANQMENTLDANSQRIINLPAPVDNNDAARWGDVLASVTGVVSFNGRQGVVLPLVSDYDASQIDNDSTIVGATVKAALDTADSRISTAQSTADNHIADTSAAHAASAISYNNSGTNLTATDEQAAITELDALIAGLPAPMQFKGGLDVSTGDAALPVSPEEGWTYIITVGGDITVTRDGTTPVSQAAQVNDSIVYDATNTQWWLFDSAQTSFVSTKQVTTPYVLTEQDSGYLLEFNNASDCTVQIPDSLSNGHNILVNNVGTGSVILSMTGSEQIRGGGAQGSSVTMADAFGMLSAIRSPNGVWQSSER